MIFMKDSTNNENHLEMRPNGRNEGPTKVVVENSSKSSLYYDGDQVGDHLLANDEAIEISMENGGHIERFGKDVR